MLGVRQDTWFTLPRGSFTALINQPILPPTRLAPVAQGETVGRLEIVHNGQALAELPLVSLSDVPEGSFVKRTTDRLRLWFGEQGPSQAAQ
jgi:D-alanyl-D-alanine carboxypeptidase (penicillin-binding protein 5/6)